MSIESSMTPSVRRAGVGVLGFISNLKGTKDGSKIYLQHRSEERLTLNVQMIVLKDAVAYIVDVLEAVEFGAKLV